MQQSFAARKWLCLSIVICLTGACGDSTVAPGDVTAGGVTAGGIGSGAPAQVFQLRGSVVDTALRPLADARVEIVVESQVVASTTSDANGQFVLTVSFAGPLTCRATKEGYLIQSQVCSSFGWVGFFLESLTPPVKIDTGDYTLTFVADSVCTDLPDDVRTRTYAATITAAPPGIQAHYLVMVPGTSNWYGLGGFSLGVAGNYIGVENDTAGQIMEQIAPGRSVELNAWSGSSVEAQTVSTLSFVADIKYCGVNSAGTPSCSTCGQNSRITLTHK